MRRFKLTLVVVSGAALLAPALRPAGQTPVASFYHRGAVYLDWSGSRYDDGTLFNQVSVRVKFDLINRPGQGWSLAIDVRDRVGLRTSATNQAILYSARLTYDRAGSPFYLSVGQMNLYDSAGIGALLGGLTGFRLRRDVLIGAYGGLESTPYISRLDAEYFKGGAFVRWLGPKGRSVSLSYNHLAYDGRAERRYAYVNAFYTVDKLLSFYGDAEYELGSRVAGSNRLSRLFGNLRLDLGRWADLTASYSQGKGLDFHRYIVEASQDPSLFDRNIERFYYSSYAGLRLSLKPTPRVRLWVSRQLSEQKDLGILNHSLRFGASLWDILGKGLSVSGDYSLNRGDLSESDSYFVSLTKDFGRFSLTGNFSSSYNGLRYDSSSGEPRPVHLADAHNVSAGAIVRIGRGLSASLEYGGFLQSGLREHFVFVRLIYRTR